MQTADLFDKSLKIILKLIVWHYFITLKITFTKTYSIMLFQSTFSLFFQNKKKLINVQSKQIGLILDLDKCYKNSFNMCTRQKLMCNGVKTTHMWMKIFLHSSNCNTNLLKYVKYSRKLTPESSQFLAHLCVGCDESFIYILIFSEKLRHA